jgi:hypothetical protein
VAKQTGNGELIHHVSAVRMRLNGSGNLDMQLSSLDDVYSFDLVPFTIATTTNIEPTRLANFKSQRIKLRFSVDEIDEWFQIRRIILFAKPVETSLPSLIG